MFHVGPCLAIIAYQITASPKNKQKTDTDTAIFGADNTRPPTKNLPEIAGWRSHGLRATLLALRGPRRWRFLVIVLALSGCADRDVTLLQPQAAQVGTLHRVHVATIRAPE